jgi:hypothetical protein
MKAVDAVEKRGKNEKQNYAYVKATDVAREVRKALIESEIAFGYDVESSERWTQPTLSGGSLNFVEMKISVTFTDTATGESVTRKGLGWGMDSGDKAPYKAMTGALKYSLRMNGLIPDELDPENDASENHANGSGKDIQRKSEKAQVGITAGGEPIFDEDGMPVVMRPAAVPAQKPVSKFVSGSTVGIPRGKRLYAICMDAGRTKEELNNYLGSIGVERCEDVPVKEYEKACEWAAGQ